MLDTNHRHLEQSLRIVSTAIASQCDLSVTFEPGAHPQMNLKTREIKLPSCPINPQQDYKAIYLGFLVHECSHAKYTPISEESLSKLGFNLANIFEDGRIEALIPGEISGAKSILSELVSKLVENGFFSKPASDTHPVNAFTGYLLYQIRAYRLNQYALRDYADQARQIFKEKFSQNILDKLDDLINELFNNVDNKFISYQLAKKAIQLLQDEIDIEQGKSGGDDSNASNNASGDSDSDNDGDDDSKASNNGSGNSDSDDDGDDDSKASNNGSGNSDSDDDGDDDSKASNNGSGDSDSDDDGDDDSKASNNGSGDSKPDETDDNHSAGGGSNSSQSDDPTQLEETLNEVLSAGSNDFEKCMGDLGDALGDDIANPSGPIEHRDYQLIRPISGLDQHLLRKAIQTSSNTAPKLKNLLVTRSPTYRRKQAFGFNFDERSFANIVTGSSNIYKRKRPSKAVDTAITLLVDASASMSGDNIHHALMTALSTCTTLEFINNLSVSVATFSKSNQVTLLKDFSQKVRSVSSAFNMHANGSTPMTEGLMWARDSILKARKQRNIVIVFTDGVPDNELTSKALIQELNQANVETWGIEFNQHDRVKDYFSNYVKIEKISDFSTALITLFKNGFQHSYI